MTMMKSNILLLETEADYAFKANRELWNGLEKTICKDKIREKSEQIGELVYRVHNVLGNRARRRRRKAHYFSARA